MATQESITGAGLTSILTAANAAAGSFPEFMAANTSVKVTYTVTHEKHNDLGDTATREQQIGEQGTVVVTGRDIGGLKMALVKHGSAMWRAGRGTCKYHYEMIGKASDGRMSHKARYCTLQSGDVDYAGQDKGGMESMTFNFEYLE